MWNIRLQTRVSQKDIETLGGRNNVSKLLKAIVRMKLENKEQLIKQYEKQKANYEIWKTNSRSSILDMFCSNTYNNSNNFRRNIMTTKQQAENYMKLKAGYISAKERAKILYDKYSIEYNRALVSGSMQQSEHWKEVAQELSKIYKNK